MGSFGLLQLVLVCQLFRGCLAKAGKEKEPKAKAQKNCGLFVCSQWARCPFFWLISTGRAALVVLPVTGVLEWKCVWPGTYSGKKISLVSAAVRSSKLSNPLCNACAQLSGSLRGCMVMSWSAGAPPAPAAGDHRPTQGRPLWLEWPGPASPSPRPSFAPLCTCIALLVPPPPWGMPAHFTAILKNTGQKAYSCGHFDYCFQ